MSQPHTSRVDTEASARRLLPALAMVAASPGTGARDAARHIARLRFALDRVAEAGTAAASGTAEGDATRLEFAHAILLTHAQRAAAFIATTRTPDHAAMPNSELESIAA
jgi:hypothetical protein